jgi:hypothetical protein
MRFKPTELTGREGMKKFIGKEEGTQYSQPPPHSLPNSIPIWEGVAELNGCDL